MLFLSLNIISVIIDTELIKFELILVTIDDSGRIVIVINKYNSYAHIMNSYSEFIYSILS